MVLKVKGVLKLILKLDSLITILKIHFKIVVGEHAFFKTILMIIMKYVLL